MISLTVWDNGRGVCSAPDLDNTVPADGAGLVGMGAAGNGRRPFNHPHRAGARERR
ncbi:MAG: hypothetical protein R3D55_14520 [Chloroflexota bacterium]